MRVKSGFVLLVSIWEALPLILISWVIERALDLLVKRLSIRLKGKVHFQYYYWKFFGNFYLSSYFTYILSFKPVPKYRVISESEFFNLIVRTSLYGHKMMHKHRVLETEKCKYCKTIIENKSFLQIYAHNPKLYPPFKFSRSL